MSLLRSSILRFTLPHVFLLMLGSAPLLAAETQTVYIDDELVIPVRSSPDSESRILHKGVRTGTALEVLTQNVNGYIKVKTPEGIEGFVPVKYISKEPVAKQKLAEAERALAALREEQKKLIESLSPLGARIKSVEGSDPAAAAADGTNGQSVQADIDAIVESISTLDRRNLELHEANEQLRNELELAKIENIRMKDKSDANMMMVGGGLIVLGVFIALLVPVLKPSKKHESWA